LEHRRGDGARDRRGIRSDRRDAVASLQGGVDGHVECSSVDSLVVRGVSRCLQ
jgi:hypothetical protein